MRQYDLYQRALASLEKSAASMQSIDPETNRLLQQTREKFKSLEGYVKNSDNWVDDAKFGDNIGRNAGNVKSGYDQVQQLMTAALPGLTISETKEHAKSREDAEAQILLRRQREAAQLASGVAMGDLALIGRLALPTDDKTRGGASGRDIEKRDEQRSNLVALREGGPGALGAAPPSGSAAELPAAWMRIVSGEPGGWTLGKAAEGGGGGGQVRSDEDPADKARALLERAKADIVLRDWASALDELTKAIALDPGDERARLERSIVYNIMRQYVEAEQDARAALKLDPKDVKAWVSLAWALLHQGRYEEAVAAASSAVALDPENAFAYAVRAYAKERLGDARGMLDDIAKAASLDARFEAQYEAAKRGEKIYDDKLDPTGFFYGQAVRPRKSAPWWPTVVGGALLAGLALSAGFFGVRRAPKQRPIARKRAPEPALAQGPLRFAGSYEILRPLGSGGSSFIAVDPAGRTVTLRKPEVPEDSHRDALRMAERWKALAHPAVEPIRDAFVDGSGLWLVFEFVEGEPVDDVLVRQGRLTLDQAAGRLGPVCHAIHAAHGRGLAHGAIHPSKLLVTRDGRSLLFGFLLPGEPGLAGASHQEDVAMLGICLRCLLTGNPLAGATSEGDRLSPRAQALLDKATHLDPAQRYASAAELSKALAAAAIAEKAVSES